jgi:hypothetical protein
MVFSIARTSISLGDGEQIGPATHRIVRITSESTLRLTDVPAHAVPDKGLRAGGDGIAIGGHQKRSREVGQCDDKTGVLPGKLTQDARCGRGHPVERILFELKARPGCDKLIRTDRPGARGDTCGPVVIEPRRGQEGCGLLRVVT